MAGANHLRLPSPLTGFDIQAYSTPPGPAVFNPDLTRPFPAGRA